MTNLLGSSHVKWHEGAETSNRCFYGLGYLVCLITSDVDWLSSRRNHRQKFTLLSKNSKYPHFSSGLCECEFGAFLSGMAL